MDVMITEKGGGRAKENTHLEELMCDHLLYTGNRGDIKSTMVSSFQTGSLGQGDEHSGRGKITLSTMCLDTNEK